MRCKICGGEYARIKRVGRAFGTGDTLRVITNIPLVSCPDCGSTYYEAATSRMLDTIKREWEQRAVVRPVAVATFPDEPAGELTPQRARDAEPQRSESHAHEHD